MRIAAIVPQQSSQPAGEHGLRALDAWRRRGHRVVVVDDGQDAGVVTRARSAAEQQVAPDDSAAAGNVLADRCVYAPAGWSRQANAGSRAPEAELADALIFVPPDVRLPPLGDREIVRSLANSPIPWGRFDIRYEDPTGALRVPLALAAAIANAGARLTGICLREQAIFVSRGAFLALGGFAPVNPRADPAADATAEADFSRRARLLGPPIVLREPVAVPAPARQLAPLLRAVWRRERMRWAIALGLARNHGRGANVHQERA